VVSTSACLIRRFCLVGGFILPEVILAHAVAPSQCRNCGVNVRITQGDWCIHPDPAFDIMELQINSHAARCRPSHTTSGLSA
jgi:hypothetical protein